MPAKIVYPNADDMIRRYLSGTSENKLAEECGVARTAIRSFLLRNGIKPRGRSAAEFNKWSSLKRNRSAVERQCGHAWKAATGRKRSLEELVLCAKSRLNNLSVRGRFVPEIQDALGIIGSVDCEYPVGPYNLDLAIAELGVGVEVQCGNHNRPRSSTSKERLEYILDRGWAVLLVWVPQQALLDTAKAGEKAVAFADFCRRNPSTLGQYGVIGRNGEPVTPRGFNGPDRPRVEGF